MLKYLDSESSNVEEFSSQKSYSHRKSVELALLYFRNCESRCTQNRCPFKDPSQPFTLEINKGIVTLVVSISQTVTRNHESNRDDIIKFERATVPLNPAVSLAST